MSAALILNAREAMLERAARAMCARHCGQCGIADTEAYFARTRDDYIALAAVVLDSVGAPELLEAAHRVISECDRGPWFAVTKRSASIDAARAAVAKAKGTA